MRAGVAGTLMLLAGVAQARDIEITQSCLPGFCVESREAFTVITRQPEKGHYRLKVYADDAVIYVQVGARPFDHPCKGMCQQATLPGEEHLTQRATGRLMARAFGPLESCAGGAPTYVTLYLYVPSVDLSRFAVERNCAALTPPRSRPSPPA